MSSPLPRHVLLITHQMLSPRGFNYNQMFKPAHMSHICVKTTFIPHRMMYYWKLPNNQRCLLPTVCLILRIHGLSTNANIRERNVNVPVTAEKGCRVGVDTEGRCWLNVENCGPGIWSLMANERDLCSDDCSDQWPVTWARHQPIRAEDRRLWPMGGQESYRKLSHVITLNCPPSVITVTLFI